MLADSNVRKVVLARFISRSGGFAAFFVGIWGKAASGGTPEVPRPAEEVNRPFVH